MPNTPAPPAAISFDLDDTLIDDVAASSVGLRTVMERVGHPDFGAARALWDAQTEISFGAYLRDMGFVEPPAQVLESRRRPIRGLLPAPPVLLFGLRLACGGARCRLTDKIALRGLPHMAYRRSHMLPVRGVSARAALWPMAYGRIAIRQLAHKQRCLRSNTTRRPMSQN